MHDHSAETDDLLVRARAGDAAAREALFRQYRDRLHKMVEIRLDRRLQARVDASDVIQEGCLDVIARLDEYLREPRLPLYLWLRLVVGERLLKVHRQHLGTQARAVSREVSLYRGALPQASSAALAAQLLGRHTSPTDALLRVERIERVQQALNSLEDIDREIVTLRHFEELNCAEAAQVLGIGESAAAKRYIRAMKRLRAALTDSPGLG